MSPIDNFSHKKDRQAHFRPAEEINHFIIQLYDYSTMWALISSLAAEVKSGSAGAKVIRLVGKSFGTSSSFQTRICKALSIHTPLEHALGEIGIELQIEKVVNGNRSRTALLAEEIPQEVLLALKLSAFSQARSILRDSTFGPKSAPVRLLAKQLFLQSQKYFLWARGYNGLSDNSFVYLPNGRMAIETALVFGFKGRGVKVKHYEASFFYSRGYLSDHAPQDKASHAQHQRAENTISYDEIDKTIGKFLIERESPKNKFFSSPRSSIIDNPSCPVITYFSSSSDEFDYLPAVWGYTSPQGTQYERLKKLCLEKLTHEKFTLVVKIHPNFMNKGIFQNIRELQEIRGLKKELPNLQIIFPKSKVNTYNQVRNSDVVITERSTIGLEALLMGKKVLCLADAAYAELVPKIIDWDDLLQNDNEKVDLKAKDIKRYLANIFEESFELHFPREYFWKFDPKLPFFGIRFSWIPSKLSAWSILSLLLRIPTKIFLNKYFIKLLITR